MQIVEPLQQSLQAWTTWLSWSSLMNTPPPSPSVQLGVSLKTRSYTVRFTLHPGISVTSSWLHISCALKSSHPIPKFNIFNGMGPRLGNGISPYFFPFLWDGIWQAIPKPLQRKFFASCSIAYHHDSAVSNIPRHQRCWNIIMTWFAAEMEYGWSSVPLT